VANFKNTASAWHLLRKAWGIHCQLQGNTEADRAAQLKAGLQSISFAK